MNSRHAIELAQLEKTGASWRPPWMKFQAERNQFSRVRMTDKCTKKAPQVQRLAGLFVQAIP
jgi:hypothetical protein